MFFQFALVLRDVDLFTQETSSVVDLIEVRVGEEKGRKELGLGRRMGLRDLQAALVRVKVMRGRYLWIRREKPVREGKINLLTSLEKNLLLPQSGWDSKRVARFAQRYVSMVDMLYEKFNAYFGHHNKGAEEGEGDGDDNSEDDDAGRHVVSRGREEEAHKLKEEAEMVMADEEGEGNDEEESDMRLSDDYVFEDASP